MAGRIDHAPPQVEASHAAKADDATVVASPEFVLPEGWALDCRGPECVADLAGFYEGDGGPWWQDVPPDYGVNLDEFEQYDCAGSASPPPRCIFEGDFDGDGLAESLAWVRHAASNRFDMVIGWRHRPMAFVGLEPWGHVNAARHFRSCAETMWQTAQFFVSAEFSTMPITVEGKGLRDAFVADDGIRRRILWFDDRHWRVIVLRDDELLLDLRLPAAEPSMGAPPPVGTRPCNEAKKIRRAAYRARNARTMLWFEQRKVARDACSYELDLERDGKNERVSWVVAEGKTGLRVDWADGRFAVLGAGLPTPIDVLEGEPGCNLVPDSFDQSWDIDIAKWSGQAWRLPDGRTHAPLDPARVEGDALAITNDDGHVDLVFSIDGEWRTSAVPFPWRTFRVFWPAQNEWNWVRRPIPEVERYRRPQPVSREWARVETPGPPPKSPGFFPGH